MNLVVFHKWLCRKNSIISSRKFIFEHWTFEINGSESNSFLRHRLKCIHVYIQQKSDAHGQICGSHNTRTSVDLTKVISCIECPKFTVQFNLVITAHSSLQKQQKNQRKSQRKKTTNINYNCKPNYWLSRFLQWQNRRQIFNEIDPKTETSFVLYYYLSSLL